MADIDDLQAQTMSEPAEDAPEENRRHEVATLASIRPVGTDLGWAGQ